MALSDAIEEAAVAAAASAAAAAVPKFGQWLAGLIDGNDAAPALTKKIRDVLPVRSASAQAADDLHGGG